jgi:SAM-dependent methyltransferase
MSDSGARLNRLDARQPPAWLPDDAVIARHLAARDLWLQHRKPHYQVQMIKDLAALLPAGRCRVLDVGAGSGVVGETIAALFPGKSVVGVDVASNGLPDLRIPLLRFDGSRLPFADRSFDCVLFCNVLHHVAPAARSGLMREALRVTGGGPLVIKDHLSSAPPDRLRLWFLDVLGNASRGFMVSAQYLDERQWGELLRELDCTGEVLPASAYRAGIWERCFPNRLEMSLRIRRGPAVGTHAASAAAAPGARPGR